MLPEAYLHYLHTEITSQQKIHKIDKIFRDDEQHHQILKRPNKLIAQTSAHYQYQYRSCLRLII